MANIVHFASKKDLARSRDRKAAMAALGPQLYAAALTGEPMMTYHGGHPYTLATAGDLQISASVLRPGSLNVVVQWEAARTAKNPYGRVFNGDFDQTGQLVGKPSRWERGEWERLIFERFRFSRRA